VHQRLLAAACVQKQLTQQAAEFKRRFGKQCCCSAGHVLLVLLLVAECSTVLDCNSFVGWALLIC
jgi:hypothetical protein